MNNSKRISLVLWAILFATTSACDRLPGFAPMRTPQPTLLPTPTVLVAGIADVALHLTDLPSGFEAIPPDKLYFGTGDEVEDWPVEASFGFVLPERDLEMVMGFTTRVSDPLEQAAFDAFFFSSADNLVEALAGGLSFKILSQSELPGMSRVGEASAGANISYVDEGETWRMDIIAFRRGEVVVFLFGIHLDGRLPVTALSGLVHKLDDRARRLTEP